MSPLLTYLSLKRDLVELWLLNGTVAFISLSDIQAIFSIVLIVLTGAYTIFKWKRDIENKKKNEPKS